MNGQSKVPNMPNIPPLPQRKNTANVSIPPRSKEQEIENLKRLLANISQRLDALKNR